MNELALLLTSFDVSVLFQVAERIAKVLGSTITPVLLILSIYIRLMETQLDSLTGNGKFGTALRDMILWTVVLGSYWGITNLVFEFFNPIYAWFDSFGSIAETMKSFTKIMEQNKLVSDAEGGGLVKLITSSVAAIPYIIASLLYYMTLVIVAFLSAFLKIANVLVLCVAFVWGFIAIPISISTTFRILKGWGLLVALALVWPIVQALMMAMFSILFENSAQMLVGMNELNVTVKATNIMMLFAVMHLLLAAVLVSAPFIANALVSNTSAVAGIVMPFVAAATAAGVATIKGGQKGGSVPSGGGGAGGSGAAKVAGQSTNYRTPTARAATASFEKSNPAPSVSGAQTAKVGVSQPGTTTKTSAQAPAASLSASPSTSPVSRLGADKSVSSSPSAKAVTTPTPSTATKTSAQAPAASLSASPSTSPVSRLGAEDSLSPSATPAPADSAGDAEKRQKQQRRGAVIRNQIGRTKA